MLSHNVFIMIKKYVAKVKPLDKDKRGKGSLCFTGSWAVLWALQIHGYNAIARTGKLREQTPADGDPQI